MIKKELLLLAIEIIPVWLLIKYATRKGDDVEQRKRLFVVIGLIMFISIFAFFWGWLAWAD